MTFAGPDPCRCGLDRAFILRRGRGPRRRSANPRGLNGLGPAAGDGARPGRVARLAGLALGLTLAVVPAPPAAAGTEAGSADPTTASVRILHPSPSDVLSGKVTIQVAVTPLGDRKVLKVQILGDGILLAEDAVPPYQAVWETGEGLQSRVIRAVAILDDGSRDEDLITTRGLRFSDQALVEAEPIEHVELLVSVTDGEGLPVAGLGPSDIRILEDGRAVQPTAFRPLAERVDLPLSIAMLVDRSGSMKIHMAKIARAATELLKVIRPVDQVRIASFAAEMEVLQDFTRDPISLLESLNGLERPWGGTNLFAAIRDTVRDMRDRPGRKVIIALTDGLDSSTTVSGPVTTSMYPILRSVARMASRAGVTIVVVLPGPTGRRYLAIQDLAVQTGGWYTYPGEDFAAMIRKLGQRLLGAYVAEYDTARPEDPDDKRSLEVSLAGDHPGDWEVTAALGTYAGLDLFDALSSDLEDGTTEQRARAAREIALFPREEAVERLREALDDREPEVRVAAIAALAQRRAPGPMEDVLEMIHDTDAGVRKAAYEAAVRYGRAAVPWLVDKAEGWGETRLEALRALGAIGGPEAAEALLEGLTHSRCSVRTAAAVGAGRYLAGVEDGGEPESGSAGERLEQALRTTEADGCQEAARAARRALERLSAPSTPTGG